MGKILIIAIAAIISAAIYSCSTSGCTDNQNSLPLAGFYSSATDGAITVDSIDIGGVGAPNDTLLYTAGTSLTEIYLPFRSTTDTSAFYFHYAQKGIDDEALNDTITFGYSSIPYFASEDCGAMYQYKITKLTHTTHLMDSVAITDSLITNQNIQRIKIYFRTTAD